MDEKDFAKLAKLRGISIQALLEIDRNVRACGLYKSEAEIARVTGNTIKENIFNIRRSDYGRNKNHRD